MKKLTYLLFLAIGVTACSVESIDSTENLLTADAKFRIQSTVTITAPEGVLCVGELYVFSVNVNTDSNFQVQQKDINGDWQQVYLANKGLTGSDSFEVVLVEGENYFRYTNQNGGGFVENSSSFTGVVCTPCENSLVAELTCEDNKTATFTFTTVDAGPIVIQGGLTNGTTITNASSNVLVRNTTHQSVQNSNSNVTRWEGDVEACEVVTVTITFTGGNGIGDWSAKRGEEVLGTTEAQACSEE